MKNLRPAFYAIICLVIFMTISLSMCAQYQNIGGNMNYTGNIRTANGIAIGDTNRSASALLHIKGASKGVVLPISTTTQMLATSSPANALLLFNSDSSKFYYYTTNNTTWNQLAGSSPAAASSQTLYTTLSPTTTTVISHSLGVVPVSVSAQYKIGVNWQDIKLPIKLKSNQIQIAPTGIQISDTLKVILFK